MTRLDELTAHIIQLSHAEEQDPTLAAEIISQAAEEAAQEDVKDSCPPRELLECLLDSFRAWVPLSGEDPSPPMLLLGEIILDVSPKLMKLGCCDPRVAGMLLPALLRAAAEVANPREMLTALLEALGEHSSSCFESPVHLLMLSLLPMLPPLLSKLSRRRLACALDALGPMEVLAAEVGKHLWDILQPWHVHPQPRQPAGCAAAAAPAVAAAAAAAPQLSGWGGAVAVGGPPAVWPTGAGPGWPDVSPWHSTSHGGAGQCSGELEQSLAATAVCGAWLDGGAGSKNGTPEAGNGAGAGAEAAAQLQGVGQLAGRLLVEPFVVGLEGLWGSVLQPEVASCWEGPAGVDAVGAHGAAGMQDGRPCAQHVRANAALADAAHACRAFAVTCLRVAWLLLGSMPPLAPPPPAAPTLLGAGRAPSSAPLDTKATTTSTTTVANRSCSGSSGSSGVQEGVWKSLVGRLLQLALTAVHAAAAVAGDGQMPTAARASGHDAQARAVSWQQVLAAVHAVHERASREGLGGWKREMVVVQGQGSCWEGDEAYDQRGDCTEGEVGAVGQEDGSSSDGGSSSSSSSSSSDGGSTNSSSSGGGSTNSSSSGGGGGGGGGAVVMEWEDWVAEERAQDNQGLQEALAGAGLAALMAAWQQRHQQQQEQQQQQQQLGKGQHLCMEHASGAVLLVPPTCPLTRIQILASMSYPLLTTCCNVLPAQPAYLVDPAAVGHFTAIAHHSFMLLLLGGSVSTSPAAAAAAAEAAPIPIPEAAAAPPPPPPPSPLLPPAAATRDLKDGESQFTPTQGQGTAPLTAHQQPLQHPGLSTLFASMASQWEPSLSLQQQRAVVAMAGPLRGACSCVAQCPEEGLRSLGHRAMHAVLDSLPTAPRCVLLQRILQPHMAPGPPSFATHTTARSAPPRVGSPARGMQRIPAQQPSHAPGQVLPMADQDCCAAEEAKGQGQDRCAAEEIKHPQKGPGPAGPQQASQAEPRSTAGLPRQCTPELRPPLAHDCAAQLQVPPCSPSRRARGGGCFHAWGWGSCAGPPRPALPRAVPLEVATLLVQRLRKDVAAAAAQAAAAAAAPCTAASPAAAPPPLPPSPPHPLSPHPSPAAAQQGHRDAEMHSARPHPHPDLASAHAPLPRLSPLPEPTPARMPNLAGSHPAAPPAALLTTPWPLCLACQLLLGSLEAGASAAHGVAACSAHHAAHTDVVVRAGAARLGPCTPCMLQDGFAGLLRVRAPVPARADLCAAALSLVRLIALRLSARPRMRHGAQHSAAQPGTASSCAPPTGLEGGRRAVVARAEEQSMQCVCTLCAEVLAPLCAWLQQQQHQQQHQQGDQQAGLQSRGAAGMLKLGQQEAGTAAGASGQVLSSAAKNVAASALSGLSLPGEVVEYTALCRLHEVAGAVCELGEQLGEQRVSSTG